MVFNYFIFGRLYWVYFFFFILKIDEIYYGKMLFFMVILRYFKIRYINF